MGPKVLLIGNPSLNLGGKSKRSPSMKRKISGFQVEVQRAWGNKGLPEPGSLPRMFEKLSHLSSYRLLTSPGLLSQAQA